MPVSSATDLGCSLFPHHLRLRCRGMGRPIIKHCQERDGDEPAVPRCYYPPGILLPYPTPLQRGHAKSMSESASGKMKYHRVVAPGARVNPANASPTSLNNLPMNSTSLAQQQVPEERTDTHLPDSPVKPASPAPIDQTLHYRPPHMHKPIITTTAFYGGINLCRDHYRQCRRQFSSS